MNNQTKKFIKNGRFYFESGHHSAAISARQAAKLVYVNQQTAERWLYGYHSPSEAVIELMRLKATGQIIPPHFEGFRFTESHLILDNGMMFNKGELQCYNMMMNEIRLQQNDQRRDNRQRKSMGTSE